MLKDLLLITAQADLATALSSFGGARILTGSDLAFAQRLLTSAQPPQALYLDDTGGTIADLWAAVRAAQAQRVAVARQRWQTGSQHAR
jgi:hypothetical protein